MTEICSIEECDHQAVKRTWCQTHYTRWHRHGDPTITRIEMHGLYGTPEYAIWRAMRDRCYNSKNKFYYLYGARDIAVSDEWRLSFAQFIKDMGEKPPGYSIERRNNDLGYSKENCYWATAKQQAYNRRNNRYIEFRGMKKTITEWANTFNTTSDTVGRRIKAGWSLQDALLKPVTRKRG